MRQRFRKIRRRRDYSVASHTPTECVAQQAALLQVAQGGHCSRPLPTAALLPPLPPPLLLPPSDEDAEDAEETDEDAAAAVALALAALAALAAAWQWSSSWLTTMRTFSQMAPTNALSISRWRFFAADKRFFIGWSRAGATGNGLVGGVASLFAPVVPVLLLPLSPLSPFLVTASLSLRASSGTMALGLALLPTTLFGRCMLGRGGDTCCQGYRLPQAVSDSFTRRSKGTRAIKLLFPLTG